MHKWLLLGLTLANSACAMGEFFNRGQSPHPWDNLVSPKSSPKQVRLVPEAESSESQECFRHATIAYLTIWLAYKTAVSNFIAITNHPLDFRQKEAIANDIKRWYMQEIVAPAKILAESATNDSFEYITDAIKNEMISVNFNYGSTFLHAAVKADRPDIVEFLFQHGANQFLLDASGFLPEAYNYDSLQIQELFQANRQARRASCCSDLESVTSSQ
jgi:hypothetical protein